ncbi:MAG: RND family transporter, partial [Alphaproteobacteria bacterium]|nr:RND family transporter [Alphaproteobacteria bacterium]
RYAFSTVGTALWVTSAILIAGFGVLSFSAFQINSSLGMLTALTLAMALIADFLLLPAVLLTVDRGRNRSRDAAMNTSQPTTQAAE